MNLNHTIRHAFVRAALLDVPQQDYTSLINDFVQKRAVAAMPASVRRVYEDKETRSYINTRHEYLPHQTKRNMSINVHIPGGVSISEYLQCDELDALLEARAAQQNKLDELENKLGSVVNSVRTRKQLITLLPEFAKYLPAEEPSANNLPAIANLVSDFIKAGWPKAEAEAHAAKLEKAKGLQKKNRAKAKKTAP